jgi:phosphoserine phosphatase
VSDNAASGYPVVVFDLDGTLLRGSSVSLLLAQWLGRGEEITELERAFHAHEISNSVVADTSAVGDSRSDVPLFREVGLSIALNATPDAQATAIHRLDTDDLRDLLPLLQPAPTRKPPAATALSSPRTNAPMSL